MEKTICHRDGTISHWRKVFGGYQYVKKAYKINDRDYNEMNIHEKSRVCYNIEKFPFHRCTCPDGWVLDRPID